MKKLLVLGAGTAGTMVVNKLRKRLDRAEWQITVVDQDATHYYQPGFLLMPFGMYNQTEVVKPKRDFIPAGVDMILCEVDAIEAGVGRGHPRGRCISIAIGWWAVSEAANSRVSARKACGSATRLMKPKPRHSSVV